MNLLLIKKIVGGSNYIPDYKPTIELLSLINIAENGILVLIKNSARTLYKDGRTSVSVTRILKQLLIRFQFFYPSWTEILFP